MGSSPHIWLGVPTYKRPEYLGDMLASAIDGADNEIECTVYDDGSPEDTAQEIAQAFGSVVYMSDVHTNACHALGRLLEYARALSEPDWIFVLCASDHILPKHWDTAVRHAAILAQGRGHELGTIDHEPGRPDRFIEWEERGDVLSPGVTLSFVRSATTCSMPSIMCGRDSIGPLAEHMQQAGKTPRGRGRTPASHTQESFKKFWRSRTGAKGLEFPLFALLGDNIRIQHVGHHEALHADFIQGRHEDYYREMGRRRRTKHGKA